MKLKQIFKEILISLICASPFGEFIALDKIEKYWLDEVREKKINIDDFTAECLCRKEFTDSLGYSRFKKGRKYHGTLNSHHDIAAIENKQDIVFMSLSRVKEYFILL